MDDLLWSSVDHQKSATMLKDQRGDNDLSGVSLDGGTWITFFSFFLS